MRPGFVILAAFDAAIIDLDGTMVDTLGDFAEALNRMLRDLELPPIAAQHIERMVGKGSEHLLRSVLNHVLTQAGKAPEAMEMEALYVRAWPSYQRHYLAINGQFASVYPGVVEGLQALRASGLRLACLTNKPTAFAVPLLRSKGLDSFFDCVFGGEKARSAAPAQDLRGLGHRGRAHADGGRFEQRRAGRTRCRLPRGAGDVWLQPRPAGPRCGCGWLG
jgi:phosphoglycolate phosphatase